MAEITRQQLILALVNVGRGHRAKLAGVDLSGLDLSHMDLHSADLAHANLKGCNLTDTILVRATLHDADLTGAILAGAFLDRAEADGARFVRANLRGLFAGDASFESCDFTDADLTGATLMGSCLMGTKFRMAKLVDVAAAECFLSDNDWLLATVTGGEWENLKYSDDYTFPFPHTRKIESDPEDDADAPERASHAAGASS